jgi:hypothetical protein
MKTRKTVSRYWVFEPESLEPEAGGGTEEPEGAEEPEPIEPPAPPLGAAGVLRAAPPEGIEVPEPLVEDGAVVELRAGGLDPPLLPLLSPQATRARVPRTAALASRKFLDMHAAP